MHRLSRSGLETFLRCQRRFQLKHLQKLPWPAPPEGEDLNRHLQNGALFHQFVAQYYLGSRLEFLDVELLPIEVKRWWDAFLKHPPRVPEDGLILVETTFTVPVNRWQLVGRIDLLVQSSEGIHIYDWKTGASRSESDLLNDWQTRLYMLLLWEGYSALGLNALPAGQLAMTYWFARDPGQPITLRADEEWQKSNRESIVQIIDQINARLEDPAKVWPLTDDLRECAVCPFRNYCGRFEAASLAGRPLSEQSGEWEYDVADTVWLEAGLLEPDP